MSGFAFMKNKWVSILLLALLLAACASGDKTLAEKLVYLKRANGNFDLYSSDVLGQWEERLTTNPGFDWQPYWNAGLGKMVYYTDDTSGHFSVVARDLSSGQTDTLPNSQLPNFKLSPDGQTIFYTMADGDVSNIWKCDLDGNNRFQLTNTNSYNGRFSISSDGEKLAFISDRTGSNELYSLHIASGELKQLTDNQLIEKYNTWSPDGKRIAVTMREEGEDTKEDIYIIELESGNITRLTSTPYAEQEISWSLSGKKIAFHGTSENDGDQIYTIDIADGKFTKITSGDFYHGEPAWLPASH